MNSTDPLDQILAHWGDLEAALQKSRDADRLAAEVTRLADALQSEQNRRGSLSRTLEGVCVALGIPANTLLMEIVRAATEANEARNEVKLLAGVLNDIRRALGTNVPTSEIPDLVAGLKKTLETAQKGNRDSFAEVERLKRERDTLEQIVSNHAAAWTRLRNHIGGASPEDSDGSLVGDAISIIEKLRRENETLARQVPPPPPPPPPPPAPEEPSVFDGPKGVEMDGLAAGELQFTAASALAFRYLVGQQWCSTIDRGFRVTDDIGIQVAHGMWVVLCNVYRDQTGALTYEPVKVSDLPKIP